MKKSKWQLQIENMIDFGGIIVLKQGIEKIYSSRDVKLGTRKT